MIAYGATDGGIPLIVKYTLDKIFVEKEVDMLFLLPAALVVFAIARAVFDFFQRFLSAKIGHLIVADLRAEINQHLLKQDPSFFVHNSSADLIARINSDSLLMRSLLTDSLATALRDVVRIITLIATAFYLDPLLALIAIIIFPMGVLPVVRYGKKIRKLTRLSQEGIGQISSRLLESILGNRVVKIFAGEEFEKDRFTKDNDQLSRVLIKSERFRAITGPINEVLASLGISAIILYGGWSVIEGARTQGEFISFLLAIFLLYDPFKKLSNLNNNIQQSLAAADRVFDLLNCEPTIKDPIKPEPLPEDNSISIENVCFSYGAGKTEALRDITLSIRAGEKIALVGFSGSGKSTLADLIPRFIDPESGTVKIGGVDIRKFKLSDLRSKIGTVSQHTFLFNDTIENNIKYGNPTASIAEVKQAAAAAFADSFISQLPNGYQTIIGEGGYCLSGGERQRIAIARAILKNAPILILDEATASLDNASEEAVAKALAGLERGKRTTIVIAHRLSTIQSTDRIYVMSSGKIVQVGTHNELIQIDNGEYQRLWRAGFSETTNNQAHPDEAKSNPTLITINQSSQPNKQA